MGIYFSFVCLFIFVLFCFVLICFLFLFLFLFFVLFCFLLFSFVLCFWFLVFGFLFCFFIFCLSLLKMTEICFGSTIFWGANFTSCPGRQTPTLRPSPTPPPPSFLRIILLSPCPLLLFNPSSSLSFCISATSPDVTLQRPTEYLTHV